MDATLFQDWITLGAPNAVTLLQSEERWLDLEDVVDLVLWIETSEANPGNGTTRLVLQTAPSRTELAFAAADLASAPSLASPGVQIVKATLKSALLPASRWLRWQLTNTGSTPWRATFRIWVSMSRAGARLFRAPISDLDPAQRPPKSEGPNPSPVHRSR